MSERIANEPVTPTPIAPQERGLVTRGGFLRAIPFLALAAASAACKNHLEQTSSTSVREDKPAQDFGVNVETTPGRTSVELFTSQEYSFIKQQQEVTRAINDFINSGRHNATEVQTAYTKGYLTAGRVTHSPDTRERGNNLRVRLIQSDQRFWNKRDEAVKKALEATLKDTQNVHKVNTIFQSGYLLAAEVWYFQP